MSSISGPYSPADGATVNPPFNLEVQGVSPGNSLVEARGENGLLLPSSGPNPVEAAAGTATITGISSLVGSRGSAYAGASAIIQAAASVGIAGLSSWARKAWDTTRVLALPELTLTAGQKAALMVAIEDGGSGYTGTNWTFSGLGFTPSQANSPGTTAGGAKTAIFWAEPGAGTYNGTITMGGADTCTFAAVWVIFDGAGSPVSKTAVNYLSTAAAPTGSFTTTGTGRVLVGIVSHVDTASAGTAATGCTIVGSETSNTPGAHIVRRTGLVDAGTYAIALSAPTGADWSVCALEVPAA